MSQGLFPASNLKCFFFSIFKLELPFAFPWCCRWFHGCPSHFNHVHSLPESVAAMNYIFCERVGEKCNHSLDCRQFCDKQCIQCPTCILSKPLHQKGKENFIMVKEVCRKQRKEFPPQWTHLLSRHAVWEIVFWTLSEACSSWRRAMEGGRGLQQELAHLIWIEICT